MDKGPIHIVDAGLVQQLAEIGWNVQFDGHHMFEDFIAENDPPIGILQNPRFVSRVTESVAKVVGDHVAKGELPVTLGGDHSLVRWNNIQDTPGFELKHSVGNGYDLGNPEVR